MVDSTIAFIGFGLIGGSIARGLKRVDPNITIMAYMRTRSKLEQAKKDGVVDIILDGINEKLRLCDIVYLCTPVEYNASYLKEIKPFLKPGALVTDVGSTKTDIHNTVIAADMENCFVGSHPMAGSEKTGYENSTDHLLENAYYIITPTAISTEDQIARVTKVAEAIGSIPIVLNYHEHDRIVAAISHLPHIVASSLVNLVRDSDNPEGMMKLLAAGGFKDITRIASASPEMWEQICMTNSGNIAGILEQYISYLTEALEQLKAQDSHGVYQLFDSSRIYRDTIMEKTKGSVTRTYAFTVDIVDEPGAISTLSVILASKGISIQNIGINHNREHGEGALRIEFYNEDSKTAAWALLKKYNYDLIEN